MLKINLFVWHIVLLVQLLFYLELALHDILKPHDVYFVYSYDI